MERQLALQFIKSRKKKNIISIITITLVTAFLTAVSLYGYSYNKMLNNSFIAFDGEHHGIITGVKNEDLSKINNHAEVKYAGIVKSVYYENNSSEDIYYDYYDNTSLGFYKLQVANGYYPKENNEVALDRLYSEKFNKKIGDTIEVLGEKFKVVGIVDNLDYKREDYKSYKVFVSEGYAKENAKETQALVQLSEPKMYEETLESIAKLVNLTNDNVIENQTAIDIDVTGMNEYAPYVLIGLLVAFSAFFIIYNIFYTALGERMKTIGLLLTIGVTGRQIRKMVLYEAFVLSLISLPFGVLLGFISTKVMMSLVNIGGDLRLIVNPLILLMVVGLTLLTVLISVILPAIKVSKLSPIEASKFTPASKTPKNNKPRKIGKNFHSDMAKVNMWRNKKSTVVTIISMVLSITLFIVSAAMLKSLSVENMVKYQLLSNVQVDTELEDVFSKNYPSTDLVNEISKIKGVKDVTALKVIAKEEGEVLKGFIGIDDRLLELCKEELVEGNIDEKTFKEGKVAIAYQSHGKSEYKLGEVVKVPTKNGDKEVKITAIIEREIIPVYAAPRSIYLYNDGEILKDISQAITFLIDANERDSKEVGEKVSEITNKHKNLRPVKTYDNVYEGLMIEKRGIQILGYTIVGVIALIGMMNFVNSTLSGIMSRRKEIGMLRAVGITDDEVKKILIKEGIYQMGVSLGIGVVLGNVLAYILVYLYKTFAGATFAVYTVPFIETIACIVVVMTVLVIITGVSTNKITKDSVVEQIRFED